MRLLNPETPEFEYARTESDFVSLFLKFSKFQKASVIAQDSWYAASCAGEWLHPEEVHHLPFDWHILITACGSSAAQVHDLQNTPPMFLANNSKPEGQSSDVEFVAPWVTWVGGPGTTSSSSELVSPTTSSRFRLPRDGGLQLQVPSPAKMVDRKD